MNVKLMSVITSAVVAMGSAAPADIISNLEVHYEFENSSNFGQNSAGIDGVPYG